MLDFFSLGAVVGGITAAGSLASLNSGMGGSAALSGGHFVICESTEVVELLFCFVAEGATCVAVVHPDALPVVPTPAFHHVVGVVRFSHFIVGVDDDLEEVISWWDVGDVDPLAVNVVSVHIPAANSDPLFPKIGTFVLFFAHLLHIRCLPDRSWLCVLQLLWFH